MSTLDDRPAPPPLPQFSREMEQFLLVGARTNTTPKPASKPATRRRARYATAGLATAALIAGAVVGIDYATSGGTHTPGANQTNTPSISAGGVHIHLAAFSVDTSSGGTVTLALTQGQLFAPATLRKALAKAGVSAVVTVGSVCTVPGHPSNGLPQVISGRPASNGRSITIITPSAIPVGEKLSFGYFPVPNGGGLHISLVPDNTPLTCTSTPPAPPHHR